MTFIEDYLRKNCIEEGGETSPPISKCFTNPKCAKKLLKCNENKSLKTIKKKSKKSRKSKKSKRKSRKSKKSKKVD
jgi:hypothetical protein